MIKDGFFTPTHEDVRGASKKNFFERDQWRASEMGLEYEAGKMGNEQSVID